jgi:hypothetical protein
VVEAIALHHHPAKSSVRTFTPLTAVHVANALVNAQQSNSAAVLAEEVDSKYLTTLGLECRLPEWQATAEGCLQPQSTKA